LVGLGKKHGECPREAELMAKEGTIAHCAARCIGRLVVRNLARNSVTLARDRCLAAEKVVNFFQ
jgi:hypothetical protein